MCLNDACSRGKTRSSIAQRPARSSAASVDLVALI
ncbi:hypothetical protein E5Q_04122 [Mixia osmundae IAM 14324]|uniref:Uncharacterized protein n=2 Tax=Mixia osmundae (strain CBS 9802 / IAM 14324 / JCM 22182 / KY 12970) TaxID=764103 RepID=G7E3N3_MIXOS|nr:hypothetical protein E5Q_04122 [Mixia osmundae IAM 14324]